MRYAILIWMERHEWHMCWPLIFKFWEWVVMPKTWGGRLGFANWLKWVMR
jgi:hypothetical protein